MIEQVPELNAIKSLSWSDATVSFYVVKRRLVQKRARYEIIAVNVHPSVQDKLRTTFVGRLNSRTGVMEYDFHTVDQDDNLLTIPTNATDFQQIIDAITAENAPPLVQAQDQIFDAWFYVARLDLAEQPPLFAVRKAPKGWATKKNVTVANLIFAGDMQLTIEPQAVFKIDDFYDFFSFSGHLFIFYKSAFETDMNFRQGIMQDRTELVAELDQMGIFQATQSINEMIGNNMRLLRKAAQVKRLGYFRDQTFMDELRVVSVQKNWELEYDDAGKLIVTAERIGLILHLLTNGRLESIINHEVFDVDAKRRVEG